MTNCANANILIVVEEVCEEGTALMCVGNYKDWGLGLYRYTECLTENYLCDGIYNCRDGEDERNCPCL